MTKDMEDWKAALRDLGVTSLIRPENLHTPPQMSPSKNKKVAATPSIAYQQPTDSVRNPPTEIIQTLSDLPGLLEAIRGCQRCILGTTRNQFVFGEGNPHADMMFVGEGPGRDEDLHGRPFVGRAGDLLEKMIEAIGLKRSEVYIANIVKCRPPDNRIPTPEEARSCLGYLQKQIEIIQPKVIVTLGATPLRELLGITEGITKVRGTLQFFHEIPVIPTFHPAYVLRMYTPEVRKAVWDDLKLAKTKIEANV
jgi:DNA polymerase